MELIDVLNDRTAPTADGWLTTTEILLKQGLDPDCHANRQRLLKQLRAKLRESVIEQTMVMRPKPIGNALSPAPAFRVKAHD